MARSLCTTILLLLCLAGTSAGIPADEFLAICADRSPEAVAKAIEEGADVNVRNNKGQTALMIDAENNENARGDRGAARTGRRCRPPTPTGPVLMYAGSTKQKPRRGAGPFEGRRRRRLDHRRPDGPDTGGGVEPEPPKW
jgi:FOG: Ankyrin repeat